MRRQGGKVWNPRGEPHGFIGVVDVEVRKQIVPTIVTMMRIRRRRTRRRRRKRR